MKITIKAYLSKEDFFKLPSEEQEKRAKTCKLYQQWLLRKSKLEKKKEQKKVDPESVNTKLLDFRLKRLSDNINKENGLDNFTNTVNSILDSVKNSEEKEKQKSTYNFLNKKIQLIIYKYVDKYYKLKQASEISKKYNSGKAQGQLNNANRYAGIVKELSELQDKIKTLEGEE